MNSIKNKIINAFRKRLENQVRICVHDKLYWKSNNKLSHVNYNYETDIRYELFIHNLKK